MALQEQQLGQLRPADTNAASIYSPGVGETAIVKTIMICNQSGAGASFRLFHDDNGTTYDESTALAWDVPVSATNPTIIGVYIAMDDSTGNLAVRSSVSSALTFTCYGAVIT